MAMEGTEISPDVKEMYESMKKHHTKKWAFFEFDRSKKVVPTQSGEGRATTTKEEDKKIFEGEVKAKLRDDQPLYILYDFEFTNKEGRLIEKIALLAWISERAGIRDKMMYTSSKDAVKKCFSGLSNEFQLNNIGDADYDTLAEEVERKA